MEERPVTGSWQEKTFPFSVRGRGVRNDHPLVGQDLARKVLNGYREGVDGTKKTVGFMNATRASKSVMLPSKTRVRLASMAGQISRT
jgi:hypothetical protein